LGQSRRILEISDYDAGLKVEKSEAVGEEGVCGDRFSRRTLVRHSQNLENLSLKKEAKLSASEMTEVEKGKSDEDL